MPDVSGSIAAFGALLILLRIWRPREPLGYGGQPVAGGWAAAEGQVTRLPPTQVFGAWLPFIVLIVVVVAWTGPWSDLPKVVELAKRKNAVLKVSGACTLSKQPYPFPDIWDPLKRIFDAWGFDRCLWGTDWTRAIALLTYNEGVKAFRVTDRLSDSDRAQLMGGSLARIYNWSPA